VLAGIAYIATPLVGVATVPRIAVLMPPRATGSRRPCHARGPAGLVWIALLGGMGLMVIRRFFVAVAATLGVLGLASAFGVGAASAALTHKYEFSFGLLSGVGGIAVDDSNGDVYVGAGGSVYKFNAAGEPAAFSATSSDFIENVGSIQQLAVDNSTGSDKGDIYAAVNGSVRIYSAGGEALGELTGGLSTEVPGAPWGEACGVSVDASGHVYVAGSYRNVEKFARALIP
jgi:hypothetical protein